MAEAQGVVAPSGGQFEWARASTPALPQRWREMVRWLIAKASRVAILLVLAVLWELSPRLGLADPTFLPALSEVLVAGWDLARSGQIYDHVGASLARALSGFLIALAYAIPLGLAIGWYRPLANALKPLIDVLRNTAPLALLPVFILLLGIGEVSKVALVIYSCSWPLLLNTIAAVQQVDPLLVSQPAPWARLPPSCSPA